MTRFIPSFVRSKHFHQDEVNHDLTDRVKGKAGKDFQDEYVSYLDMGVGV